MLQNNWLLFLATTSFNFFWWCVNISKDQSYLFKNIPKGMEKKEYNKRGLLSKRLRRKLNFNI